MIITRRWLVWFRFTQAFGQRRRWSGDDTATCSSVKKNNKKNSCAPLKQRVRYIMRSLISTWRLEVERVDVRSVLWGSAGTLGKTDNCRLRCCPLTCQPAHPQLRGLSWWAQRLLWQQEAEDWKLVFALSRTYAVESQPNVSSQEKQQSRSMVASKKKKKKIIHVDYYQTCCVCPRHLQLTVMTKLEEKCTLMFARWSNLEVVAFVKGR